MGRPFDVVVAHRDADSASYDVRRREIDDAISAVGLNCEVVPVVPVRMTEAWLLLDEAAIRHVAGNPRGRKNLNLPAPAAVERLADPKSLSVRLF